MDDAKNQEQLHAYTTGLLQGTAYSKLQAKLNLALLPFSVSIPEWKLLGQVHEQGSVKLSELAGLLSYDPPMVTKLVKQLEKKGLVKREADIRDERAKIITNTSKGDALVVQAEPAVKQAMNSLLQGITKDELLVYLKVLSTIVKNSNLQS